ncbi:MAG TPA: hypothetical protein VF665_16770 [Longimicrobium sp.]|jgi:hypothetical protein|uniref:hypothetical protein n=1 Tax=Longimicrobium sp. TaxID=2029185 RepID=UPI002ED9A73C
MLRNLSYVIAGLLLLPVSLAAQVPGRDTLQALTAVHARLARTRGDATWPGFRPDTIPVVFVLRGRGSLMVGWRGGLPDGWVAAAGGSAWLDGGGRSAASTGVQLGGRGAA